MIMKPKLNATVSVIELNETMLEFFKTNTRQQIRIKVNSKLILNLISSLDGVKSVEQIAHEQKISVDDLMFFLSFLQKNGILDTSEPKTDFFQYDKYRRVIHFLNDYASSHDHLLQMWTKIRNAKVLVIGLGAVGTWVACTLAESGIGTLILMDADVVDESNLHRQFGFTEADIGKPKTDVLKKRLQEYTKDINVITNNKFLTDNSLLEVGQEEISLIINCADSPNVDTTSLWVGEYCMKHNIPHIIGGGYNMHLSLIGQTVLPGQSACVKCFQKKLEEENTIDSCVVKKLAVKNRKIGSFAPMCSLISSMIGMEAIKIISHCTMPANINRRGEFDIFTMDIKYKPYERRTDCEWCGKNGLYYSS